MGAQGAGGRDGPGPGRQLWLRNTAAVFRVLPFILPPKLFEMFPAGGRLVHGAFGLSGLIALSAVVCLATNLWRTARPSM